jgi:hypothetical protein
MVCGGFCRGLGGLPSGQAAGGFSQEKFSGNYAPAQWGVDGGNIHNENSFNLVDTMQWVRGKHSISFGGQIQWLQDDVVSAIGGSTPLALNFSYAQTAQFKSGSQTIDSKTGLPFASFILAQWIPETTPTMRPKRRPSTRGTVHSQSM